MSDFVAMTTGGWCLGNGWAAWVVVRNWRWATGYGVLVYLWAFSVLEAGVLVWFRDKLRFEGVLTWPYLVMLGLGLVAAVRGVLDAARARPFPPAADGDGPPMPAGLRRAVVAFVVFVGFLGLFGVVATGFGTSQKVFPEPLSAFTLRAFAAFYLSLAIGALTLLPSRTAGPTADYMRAGMGLIVPITLAAFVYIGRFDFAAHPAQVAYIAAYLVVAIAVVLVLPRLGRP